MITGQEELKQTLEGKESAMRWRRCGHRKRREEKILQCLVLVKSAGKRNGVTVTSGLMCSHICRFIYSFILTKVESSKSDTHCNVITHPLTARGGRGECGCRMGTKSTKACSKEREERKYTKRGLGFTGRYLEV